jgi:NodT family efflux transporter outer membrane factor (OMF) lipoprotein
MATDGRTIAVLLAAAMLAAGCASPRGLSTDSTPARADGFASGESLAGARLSAAAWPRTDWWRRLDDPQLDRLMDEAFAGNPGLRIAQARERQALAFARTTRSGLYPSIAAEASVTRQRFSESGLAPPPFGGTWQSQADLRLTFDYEFDLWGGNRAAYERALGQAAAAEVESFAARLALSIDVAQAYLQLERTFMQRDIAEKALHDEEELLRLTRQRFDAGIDSRLAIKQAEAALPATRERIAQLDETIGLTRNQLAALLGQGPDRGLAIERPAVKEIPTFELPSVMPAELVGRRPDVVAQRWRVEAARSDIAAARAEFYPNVNLAAFAGFESFGLSNLLDAGNRTLGAGPAISLPIFGGGRLRANLAGKDAEYDAAVELYNQTLVDALRDVVDQLTSFRGVEEQRRQQALGRSTAQEAYDLALLRFREGVGNYLEVLTAESRVLEQETLGVDLSARELSLWIGLTRALGGGFEEAGPRADVAGAHPAP